MYIHLYTYEFTHAYLQFNMCSHISWCRTCTTMDIKACVHTCTHVRTHGCIYIYTTEKLAPSTAMYISPTYIYLPHPSDKLRGNV